LDDSALALGSALPNLKENEGTDPKENEGNWRKEVNFGLVRKIKIKIKIKKKEEK
jgi:hypothetical protein